MAVTMNFEAALKPSKPHAVVDGGDNDPPSTPVQRFPAAAEQARPPDHGGGHRVEHKGSAVDVGGDRPHPSTDRPEPAEGNGC